VEQLPSHSEIEGYKCFDVDETEAQILFKCELTLKQLLKYVAKNDGRYGNTITSVITNLLVKGLEEDFKYKFNQKLSSQRSGGATRTGEAIPYAIKSKILNAQERSSISYYANDISAKVISVEEATAQMNSANAELLAFLAQGYNLDDLHPNKKSFGYKWSEGDWIYEISQKTDEEETVMVNGNEITRKKRLDTDRHYLQYLDNGIEVIAPNLFENALYKSYSERDPYFNNELRKVELQGITYKKDGNEFNHLIDECCPPENIDTVKTYINDKKNINIIGVHLVKLKKKNERMYRHICLDCYNKSDDTYKQFVFMVDRGDNRSKTAKNFYQEFSKILGKKK